MLLVGFGLAVALALAVLFPQGPMRTFLEQQGLTNILPGGNAPTEMPFDPYDPQQGQDEPFISDTPALSSSWTDLGTFPVFVLMADGLYGQTGSAQAGVEVRLPPEWGHADGQFFDQAGQKVGEILPGPFEYGSSVTCSTRPYSEMGGPPLEDYGFDFENVRGNYRLTSSYCGGGVDTYSGNCFVHSYCIEPGSGRPGLMVNFLELSSTTNQGNGNRYDHIVDSVRLQTAN